MRARARARTRNSKKQAPASCTPTMIDVDRSQVVARGAMRKLKVQRRSRLQPAQFVCFAVVGCTRWRRRRVACAAFVLQAAAVVTRRPQTTVETRFVVGDNRALAALRAAAAWRPGTRTHSGPAQWCGHQRPVKDCAHAAHGAAHWSAPQRRRAPQARRCQRGPAKAAAGGGPCITHDGRVAVAGPGKEGATPRACVFGGLEGEEELMGAG